MAKNQITGKVIAVSDRQSIASKDPSKQPMVKRQLFIDCTRYDPYTGERGFENTPLLDFSGKGLEKLEGLIAQGLKKDDVITVTFDIQGNKWTNQDNKMQIITSIRPYDIEFTKPKAEGAHTAQPAQQPAPQQAAAPQGHVDANGEPLPF